MDVSSLFFIVVFVDVVVEGYNWLPWCWGFGGGGTARCNLGLMGDYSGGSERDHGGFMSWDGWLFECWDDFLWW